MNHHTLSLAAAFLVALSRLAAQGQVKVSSGEVSPLSRQEAPTEVSQADREAAMAEDMEVMKRILDEALEAAYGQPLLGIDATGALVKHLQSAQNRIPDALAAYLDGHGIVYQLSAPPLHKEPERGNPDSSVVANPPTLWEATRQRVLAAAGDPAETKGDDVETPSGWMELGVPDRPNALPTRNLLTEKLLDALAENGHNFRHLEPEERLTVAITFSKEEKPSSPPAGPGPAPAGAGGSAPVFGYEQPGAPYGSMGSTMGMQMEMGDYYEGEEGGAMMGSGGMMGGGAEEDAYGGMEYGMGSMMGGPAGMMSAFGDYAGGGSSPGLTAGDLHLRQGNYRKAVDVYEKAIKDTVKADPYQHKPTAGQVLLYRKLIQALVGAGDYGKAEQLMEVVKNARAQPRASKHPGPRFPARLVVSVTKAQLDQVAAGKMTRQEFDKQATVDYIDPSRQEAEGEETTDTSVPGPVAVDEAAPVRGRRIPDKNR